MDNKEDLIDLSELTFVDEDKYDEVQKNLQAETKRVDRITNLFQQLLDKLKSDPEKSVIKWPNRIEDVRSIEQKLKEIYEGK